MPNIPPCGPERDRAVAELLGISVQLLDTALLRQAPHYIPEGRWSAALLPSYSTSPAAAFEALEMWRGLGPPRTYAIAAPDPDESEWRVCLWAGDTEVLVESECHAPTFPDTATAALLRAGGAA